MRVTRKRAVRLSLSVAGYQHPTAIGVSSGKKGTGRFRREVAAGGSGAQRSRERCQQGRRARQATPPAWPKPATGKTPCAEGHPQRGRLVVAVVAVVAGNAGNAVVAVQCGAMQGGRAGCNGATMQCAVGRPRRFALCGWPSARSVCRWGPYAGPLGRQRAPPCFSQSGRIPVWCSQLTHSAMSVDDYQGCSQARWQSADQGQPQTATDAQGRSNPTLPRRPD
jgi:hypothetical protein